MKKGPSINDVTRKFWNFRPPQLWFQPLCLLPGIGKHFEAFIYLASVCYLGLDYSVLISNAKFWGLLAFYCISRFKAYKSWKQQLKCYMRGAREGGGGQKSAKRMSRFYLNGPLLDAFFLSSWKVGILATPQTSSHWVSDSPDASTE